MTQEGNKDIPIQRGPEEVKREMIEYFGGVEITEDRRTIRREAFFNKLDELRYNKEQEGLVRDIDQESQKVFDIDKELIKLLESKLGSLEFKIGFLEREIDKNQRLPGYTEAYQKSDSFIEELDHACHREVGVGYEEIDESEFRQRYEELYDISIQEVCGALIELPE